MVSIEMIRRKVKNRAHLRAKVHDAFQLETAHLGYRNRIFIHLSCHGRIGIAYIADNVYIILVILHDLAQQGGRRGLPIGAGDRQNIAFAKRIGKFYLADHLDAPLSHLFHHGKVCRNAGT